MCMSCLSHACDTAGASTAVQPPVPAPTVALTPSQAPAKPAQGSGSSQAAASSQAAPAGMSARCLTKRYRLHVSGSKLQSHKLLSVLLVIPCSTTQSDRLSFPA